jgi:uncharacterized caspase-like protein
MKKRFYAPAAACVALLGLLRGAEAQDAHNPRIALVIGEAAYLDQTLPTSANDAGLVAQVLQAAGFDVVGARDLDEKSVRAALRDFLDKANAAGPDMQAFVYLAGRAVQYEGDNFFVPIDARIDRASDAPIEAVRLTDFTHALAAAPGVARIVVIDGARANPYARGGSRLAGGLALVEPETGELIAFNSAPGSIGADEPGPYGIYAKTLAGTMREGGVGIDDVFAQVRVAVNQATAGAQVPWDASKLGAPYYIFERAADAPPPREVVALSEARRRPIKSFPVDQAYAAAVERDTLDGYDQFVVAYPDSPQARRARAILAARREALFWRRARAGDDKRGYWTYLDRYPHGPHAGDADRRLRQMSARLEPPQDFAPVIYEDLPPPPRAEIIYADRPVYVFDGPDFGPPPPPPPRGFMADDDDWRDLPPPPPPVAYGVLPALAIAVPLLLTARAYHGAGNRDGHAAVGAPPPRMTPLMAPPLPGGVHPRPTAQGQPQQVAPAGGQPPGDAQPPAGGKPFPGKPALNGAPETQPPGAQPNNRPPLATPLTPSPTPAHGLPAPAGAPAQALPTPLPTPGTPPAHGGPAPTHATPAPVVAPAPASPTPPPTPAHGGGPAPAHALPSPAAPDAASDQKAPSATPEHGRAHEHEHKAVTQPDAIATPAPAKAPEHKVEAPASAPAPVHAAPPAPARAAPPAPAPVHVAPPPAAPAPVHAAPPAPVHAAPPPPAPAPIHAAPPPPAPAPRAAAPPAPAPAHVAACGKPGEPACPK